VAKECALRVRTRFLSRRASQGVRVGRPERQALEIRRVVELSLSVSPPDGEVLRNARRKSAIEVKLSLITPMFGGSADAGQVDPHRPVTAKSIRGHLRFWWRACRAGQFRSVDDMFRREAEIWGAAAEFNNKGGLEQGPGAVDLEVEVTNAGQRVKAKELISKASSGSGPQEGVFMFPFQRPAADALLDVSFTLRLFLKSEGFKEDVRDALIAWILFGGVGARTRRGCGALKLEGGLEDYPSDVNALRDWAGRLPTPPPEPWITCLSGVRAVLGKADSAKNAWRSLGTHSPRGTPEGDTTDSAEKAWRSLGTYWSRFRKGHIGRYEYRPVSGGRWPDHQVLKQRRGKQSLSLVKPFLGLPIVYQRFPGSFGGTVEPEDSGRMASPVILKPLALGNREVRPAVVVLRAPGPGRVKVKGDEFEVTEFEVTLPQDDPIIESYGGLFEAVLKSATKHFTDADCIGF